LDEDRRTLRTVIPPSSTSVEVCVNGKAVPPGGILTAVQISGLQPGPFTIEADDNAEVLISVNGGATQSVTLPTGVAVSAALVASAINDGVEGISVESERGRIVITQDLKGESATVLLDGGNAHATLGFPETRLYRGRVGFPGWRLVRDPLSPVSSDRVVYFDRALPASDDRFELSYLTQRSLCRRCGGLGIENDFRYGTQGDVILIQNESLLLQEVEKIVFTIQGSNVFHQWYGTSLINLIGTKISGPNGGQFLETRLVSEIQTALDRYISIKARQATEQPVTTREQLSRIVSIEVIQDRVDPTIFRVKVALENRANQLVRFEDTLFVLDAPLRIN